jgi:hypothetical protein
VKQADEEAALRRMLELWSRELSRGARDFEVERKFLSRCAEQLAAARRAMIALWPRVLLGLLSTVMLVAMVQQGVRLWVSPFGRGASGTDFRLMVLLAMAAAVGAMVGVCAPYLMELSRGRRAGAALARDAAILAEGRKAAIDRRINLCERALKVMAPNLAAVAEARLVSRIAARAWKACRDVFDRLKRGEDATPAAEPEPDYASLDEAGRFSLAAYNELSLFWVDFGNEGAEAKGKDQWEKALSSWKEQMPKHDYRRAGWLPAAEIDRLLGEAVAQLRGGGSVSSGPPANIHEGLRNALLRWSPPQGHKTVNLGMLSLHFIPKGKNLHVATSVGGDPSFASLIRKELRTSCKLTELKAESAEDSAAVYTPISPQIAFVVQEIRVSYDPKQSLAESDGGFTSAPSLNLPGKQGRAPEGGGAK